MEKKKRITAFFDYIDFESDVESMGVKFAYAFGETDPYSRVDFYPCKTEKEFEEKIRPGCLALVDYGAISMSGNSSLAETYDKFILDKIKEYPSVIFVFILTMGREYYTDEIFEQKNVMTVDRCCSLEEWKKILNS